MVFIFRVMLTELFLKKHSENLPPMNKNQFKEVKFISVNDIYANQKEIDSKVLNEKLKGKNLSTCYVAVFNGKNILIDGHHTVISKILNGKRKVKVLRYHIT
jgi:hypothetical protein